MIAIELYEYDIRQAFALAKQEACQQSHSQDFILILLNSSMECTEHEDKYFFHFKVTYL